MLVSRRVLTGIFCILVGFFAPGTQIELKAATGAKIAWVSFHPDDNTPSAAARTAGFTQAPDVEYTKLLRNAGHQVTRYVSTATPDVDFLNTFDLIIISRSVPSGHYQTADSSARWHSITKPTILMGGYILRASRLGYTYGETIPDTSGTVQLAVLDPAHPIFFGVPLNELGIMRNPYAHRVTFNGILQRGISVNTSQPTDGAKVLATIANETDAAFGGMVIAEYPAGTFMANASGNVTAAKRMVLLTGSREQTITAEGAGIFDLDRDGTRLFLNAVSYMAGLPMVEPPPLITNLRPSVGTRQHYAPWGLSFQVSTGDPRGIPATNIVLVLNGQDVSSSLNITGTAQERVVSYNGLTSDREYTGTITVRDASGRESTMAVNFDTRPVFTLPASWAYPLGAANTAAPGMRALIAQTDEFVTLANSEARAEAQLRGTLTDPATGAPFANYVTPSTDNPDGSYNQNIINWNVQAGWGPERGSFQAPQYPDQVVPGIFHGANIAAEIIAYLELSPGRYIMGVNSDDGFAVYSGVHTSDLLGASLGRFDGGRGAADTLFHFEVAEAGLYPFRLIYYQGGGEGNLEWFTVNPDNGEKILINDREKAGAVRSWRQITAPDRPYVSALTPRPGAQNVDVAGPITILLQDAGAQVQASSVQLSLNGQTVQPTVSKNGGVTTVTFNPTPALKGDTTYTVDLQYQDSASNQRTATYTFNTRFVPDRVPVGANIVWVSFHPGDEEPSGAAAGAGFTTAPDVEYTRLLRAAGHTVTRYVSTSTPDVDYLNTFDLVIISRSVPSGHYQTAESTALWHSITKPTIIMGGYILRANRLGYTTGDTIPDTGGTIRLNVTNPNHPIFAGVRLTSANLMERPYAHLVSYNGTVQRGISVNTNPAVPGATVLATVGTAGDPAAGGMIIAEYPAGTTMGNASANVTAGRRLVLLSGSREQGITAEAAGIYDLDNDGARLFLNAVRYMANLPEPAAVALTAGLTANRELVISWPAAGTDGYVLKSTASLNQPEWQTVTATPTVADGKRSVTVPTSGAARYFQLVRE